MNINSNGVEEDHKNLILVSTFLQNVVNLFSTSVSQDSLMKSFYIAMKISCKLLTLFYSCLKEQRIMQLLHYFPSQCINPLARTI